MANKTIVLLIVLMAVIGLSGIATAKVPRDMHKNKCDDNKGDKGQVDITKKDEKSKCDDNKDEEDDDCNNGQPGIPQYGLTQGGSKQGGEKGKCDDKKDEDDDKCNKDPVVGIKKKGKNGKVCGHYPPGPIDTP